jgi:hypothetical protein
VIGTHAIAPCCHDRFLVAVEDFSFIELMARISQLETSLRELTTRSHSLQLATVTAIDPNTRRIRVSREIKAISLKPTGYRQGDQPHLLTNPCHRSAPLY